MSPVRSFDWKTKTSPLSALGGMKGVGRAYDILSEVVGQERYSPNAEKPLGTYSKESKSTIDISQVRVEGTMID